MPSWQRAAPGEGTGHGAHLPSESARALEALNNADFDTNELGIFRHREGAEQGKRVQPGQEGRRPAALFGAFRAAPGTSCFPKEIRQWVEWGEGLTFPEHLFCAHSSTSASTPVSSLLGNGHPECGAMLARLPMFKACSHHFLPV